MRDVKTGAVAPAVAAWKAETFCSKYRLRSSAVTAVLTDIVTETPRGGYGCYNSASSSCQCSGAYSGPFCQFMMERQNPDRTGPLGGEGRGRGSIVLIAAHPICLTW